MAPRFWIALRCFTMTFFRDMATAPLARLADTIMGSISGVRPTATDSANNAACTQSPFAKPLRKSTTGTMPTMNRMSTHDTAFTPFSKFVRTRVSATRRAKAPNSVSLPTAITRARAEPLTTVLPMNARLLHSSGLPPVCGCAAVHFSIGSLSPVSDDWLTKRSLVSTMRTSAGIMSPAASRITSPTTSSEMGRSRLSPSRKTAMVVLTIACKRSAALPERTSCTNRSVPLMKTMMPTMRTAVRSRSSGSTMT